jgi:uncharacterized protein (TIGR02246 family)
MTDEQQISALQQNYAALFDARDIDGFAALFAEDAELVVPGGLRLRGHERFRKAVANMPPGGTHHPEAATIEIDADTATATSRFRFVPPSGPEVTGVYEDRFVRTADGWRFSFRRSVQD